MDFGNVTRNCTQKRTLFSQLELAIIGKIGFLRMLQGKTFSKSFEILYFISIHQAIYIIIVAT